MIWAVKECAVSTKNFVSSLHGLYTVNCACTPGKIYLHESLKGLLAQETSFHCFRLLKSDLQREKEIKCISKRN